MNFLIRDNWVQLNKYVWKSLEKTNPPYDIYIELYRYQGKIFEIPLKANSPDASKPMRKKYKLYENAINNSELARKTFFKFETQLNETVCIKLLEGYYQILNESYGREIAETYRYFLSNFVIKHNLRYEISTDCKLKISIPGLLISEYSYLQKILGANKQLSDCLIELNTIIPNLSQLTHKRNCIRVSSNLLEGMCVMKSNYKRKTFTKALEHCPKDMFPHYAIKNGLTSIYDFACDYPNLRHPGTMRNQIRELKEIDALLMLSLAICYTSFLIDTNSGMSILAGDF